MEKELAVMAKDASEKMMILNMLQEGKITAEEASQLLSTVDKAPGASTPRAGSGKDSEPLPNNGSTSSASTASRPATPSIDFEDLGRKFAAFAKDMEPKVQKVAEVVAEKTVMVADRISKSLDGVSMPRAPVSPAAPVSRASAGVASGTGGMEQNIELVVADGYNELNLSGLNGMVSVKGYNGDKITATINYKANRHGANIELMKLGGKYYLNYEEDDFEFVSFHAYVPSHKFKVVNISGMNGNMDVSGISCETLQISNSNGQTMLSDLLADSIKSESGNGKLTLSSLAASTAVIEHFNGVIESGDLDVEKLGLTNFNGAVSVNMSAFVRYTDYLWSVETSNAKLTMNVPTLPTLGYHIRSHVTLGNIRIGLTGLEFLVNDPTAVEARTASFDSCDKKVRLSLETSNAPLTVN